MTDQAGNYGPPKHAVVTITISEVDGLWRAHSQEPWVSVRRAEKDKAIARARQLCLEILAKDDYPPTDVRFLVVIGGANQG